MANAPQQQSDAEDENVPGAEADVSGLSESAAGSIDEALGAVSDVRTSDAPTMSGRARDAMADVAGSRAYRAGAKRVGTGLGIDLDAQKQGAKFRFNRESVANARDAFAQGRTDRSFGGKTLREGVRQQNQMRIARSAASGAVAGAGKQLGKEAVKDTAKVAAKTGAKAVPGAGLVTAIPAKEVKDTVQDTARELANLRVGRAAKRLVTGLGKSAAITVFRASYDPYVIGFTGGLSLIVTFLLGSVLILVPGSLTNLERLLVGMIWALIIVVLCILLVMIVMVACTGFGVPGLALKAVSLVSSTASSFDAICAQASILNILSGTLSGR